MEDLKEFLTEKVLLFESDTLTAETEKVLQQIRREKTDKAVIFVSSGTSSIIAGAEKTGAAIK
jgi:predicted RNA methylase